MLDKKNKEKVIKKYQTHESDTGSAEVQVAILTEEIKHLTRHLQAHKKDYSSRRGLIRKVNERHGLVRYLSREDSQAAEELKEKLNIK